MKLSTTTDGYVPCKHDKHYVLRFYPISIPQGREPRYVTGTYNASEEQVLKFNRKVREMCGDETPCQCARCKPDTS